MQIVKSPIEMPKTENGTHLRENTHPPCVFSRKPGRGSSAIASEMLNEVASVVAGFPLFATVSVVIVSSFCAVFSLISCVRSGRATGKNVRKTRSALSPGTVTKSAVTGKTTQSSKPTTTSSTKPNMATKSIDTTKGGKVVQNGNAATSAGSKDPMPKPSASNEKDKQEAGKKGGKSKSVMKPPPEPPLQEQPTQRPTVREEKPGQKDAKPAAKGQKGDKNHKPNKSLRVERTQMGSVKGLSGSDDCTEKCGTPELVLDRTQRSVSVKLADDEDTNENIDELPMDDHLSE